VVCEEGKIKGKGKGIKENQKQDEKARLPGVF
jgi:hypothetical protein